MRRNCICGDGQFHHDPECTVYDDGGEENHLELLFDNDREESFT